MVQFHRVTIGDKPFVDRFVLAEDSRSADFNFGNIYLWDTAYRQFLTSVDGPWRSTRPTGATACACAA